jgi:hypothetical protein
MPGTGPIPNGDGGKYNTPCDHCGEPFNHKLWSRPLYGLLPVFVVLADRQRSPWIFNGGDAVEAYDVEHEVSRHRPALNSTVYNNLCYVDRGDSQSDEIDKLV